MSAAVVLGTAAGFGAASPALATPAGDSCASLSESRQYWATDLTYFKGDLVNYNEKLYRALEYHQRKYPLDTNWWVVAECPSTDPDRNVARDAVATASSERGDTFRASNAIDGVIGQNGTGEWASKGESTPSITLTWDTPQVIDEIRVYDRPNSYDWGTRGTLSFSDGTQTEYVVWIDNSGSARLRTFVPREVTWVKFQIDDGRGDVGLSEIQAFHRGTTAAPTPNLAREATASASSVYDARYPAANAIDGIVGQNGVGEWVSRGELKPSITLTLPGTQTINQVTLGDRPNLTDQVRAGVLSFSDGSTVEVGALGNDGTPRKISFAGRQASWVKFQVTDGVGSNVGLSEFEVRRSN
ncbi:discoidin domain-containing protein [Leifsonia soli]|uniref:DUF7402 domain-containing protein n=1 Tax=Leifsonia soli TaxID=582665 RepID=A0A852T0E0_9MICO|nr:discoidin domain-containing protein [Leifsonia soli]NYD74978.1 hypothetical protein [Leifsonia soli]